MAKKRKPVAKMPANKSGKHHPPEDDAALWRAFARNIDPLDLKGRVPDTESSLLDEMLRRENTAPPPHAPKAHPPGKAAKSTTPASPKAIAKASPQPGQIDNRQVRKIGKGRETIDARIDLHGMRQSEAHSALRVFLFRAVAKGHRMVLVITGKGKARASTDDAHRFGSFVHEGASERGVLRRNVPLWLAEPDLRAIVVGHTPAHIRHGGDGALYIQLRRRK